MPGIQALDVVVGGVFDWTYHFGLTQTVVEKGLCLDAFRACRQMENEAFFTINQCDHKTVDLIIESNR